MKEKGFWRCRHARRLFLGGDIMKYSLAASVAASLLAIVVAAPAQAVLIDATTIIPDSEVIINLNGTGLDWVYAGPIAPNEFGAGNIQPATYRAAEGWRVATAAEWALRPLWTDFLRPGASIPAGYSTSDHSSYRFTSEYWSDYTHVDFGDYEQDRVTDGVNGVISGVPETIYVRSSVSAAVPEPATWAMMILGFGVVGFAMRRKTVLRFV